MLTADEFRKKLKADNPIMWEMIDHKKRIFSDDEYQAWLDNSVTAYVAAEEEWAEIRRQRNALLSACDWTQMPDTPANASAWLEYRQSLRDLPDNIDPYDPVWPTPPEN